MSGKTVTFLCDLMKSVIVLFIMALMLGFAKAAQYASVDAYGSQLGFSLASLMALAPIILAYYVIAKKLPPITVFGRSYG